ncbi:hypothetical protein CHARACLAT_023455 [Characodon lateralis]|uniref:Uncharacterized protein n=1 Tax=Characodon lateralis TaxID=208331 RepID=A0ABU7EW37_9TELE|nr:hypothetical protein [Characodon lateralis]
MKKTKMGVAQEWESIYQEWDGTGFFSFMLASDWDGTRHFSVGAGWGRRENPLPCHPLVYMFLELWAGKGPQFVVISRFMMIHRHLPYLNGIFSVLSKFEKKLIDNRNRK